MIKDNCVIKSQIDFDSLFQLSVLFSIIIGVFFSLYLENKNLIYVVLLILSVLLLYFFISFLTIFYFYDNKIKIKYPLRFLKKSRFILYTDLEKIRYVNLGARYARPTIVFVYKGHEYSKFYKPSRYTRPLSFKKRKEILEFLSKKNLLIEIESEIKRDNEILKGCAKIISPN